MTSVPPADPQETLKRIAELEAEANDGVNLGWNDDVLWLCSLAREAVRKEQIVHAATGVLLCFEDWPAYEGTDLCRAEREHALYLLRESFG